MPANSLKHYSWVKLFVNHIAIPLLLQVGKTAKNSSIPQVCSQGLLNPALVLWHRQATLHLLSLAKDTRI
jgi:hypothetical protein